MLLFFLTESIGPYLLFPQSIFYINDIESITVKRLSMEKPGKFEKKVAKSISPNFNIFV